MKILFTSKGNDWESAIDSVFGRAYGYLLYNEEKNKLTWFSNEKNRDAAHGAGVQAGQYIAEMGADVVITGGNVGPKASEVLKEAGIKIYSGAGKVSVKEAFIAYKNGELEAC